MKHAYLSIVLLIGLSLNAVAQKKPLTIPVHNYPEHYFEALDQNSTSSPDMEAVNNSNPIPAVVNRGGGGALWQEDFGGGFPTGWAVDDVSGISPWKWTTNGSHGYWNGTNAAGYADPISSTTAGNGFLINDPDSANHFSYGQPSGTTYEYLESYFATDQIDLGASYSSLLLQFEQSFRFNNSVDMIVMVSADSVNWTEYTVQGGVDNNTASDDPALVNVNISAAVGASQYVYLKIGWNARVYFWMIDDMQIVEGLDNDLELTKAYHGDVVLDYQYSKIPLEQTTEMVVGAAVTNLGGITQTGVTIDYDIQRDGSSVSTGQFIFTNPIVAADTDTAWYSTGYTPNALGDYTVSMTVSADNTDENLSNQSSYSAFEMTDSIFAHDYDEEFDIQVWGQADGSGMANPYGHGSVFIAYNNGSSIYGIDVAFGSNTSANTSVIAEVHELGANIQDIVDSYQTVYDIESQDINQGSNFFFTTIVLDDEVILNAGTGYIIAIQSEGGLDSLWILSNTGDEDFSTTLYGPYGAGGAVNWYNGWNHTPGIRMRLNAEPAGIEDAMAEFGFGVYPNPASQQVTIRFAQNANIQNVAILDVNGKMIRLFDSNVLNASMDVNLDGISAGVYFINVTTDSSSATQKLIIQ
jgi:hypothetical protein